MWTAVQVSDDIIWKEINEQVLGVTDNDERKDYTEQDKYRIVFQAAQVGFFE